MAALSAEGALVQIAARGAFREAMPKAGVRLLEPVMKVSV